MSAQAALRFSTVDWKKGYGAILADPPWPERGGGRVKRGADRHYPVMSLQAIADLEVADLALPDAHLYLWVTNNYLPAGLEVMRAWGFTYVSNRCWAKAFVDRDSQRLVIQQGLGQYFRGAHELLLFGRRGQPGYKLTLEGKRLQVPSLLVEPRTAHSRKPDVVYRDIERVSSGPYIELFARRRVEGWDAWGNEVST